MRKPAVFLLVVVLLGAAAALRPLLSRMTGRGGTGPASGPGGTAARGRGPERWSASDEEMERMRAEASKSAAAAVVVPADAPAFEKIAATLKARFAPGEKPTAEKVRGVVADVVAESDRLWATTAPERLASDCLKGRLDIFIPVSSITTAAVKLKEEDSRIALLCSPGPMPDATKVNSLFDAPFLKVVFAAGKGEVDKDACAAYIMGLDNPAKKPFPAGEELDRVCLRLRDFASAKDPSFIDWLKPFQAADWDQEEKAFVEGTCANLKGEDKVLCDAAKRLFKSGRGGVKDCANDVLCLAAHRSSAVCAGTPAAKRQAAIRSLRCREEASMLASEVKNAYRNEAEGARENLERLKGELRQAVPTLGNKEAQAGLDGLIAIADAALGRIQSRGKGDSPGQQDPKGK